MAISFIDVYKAIGKSDTAMDKAVFQIEALAKNMLMSNQSVHDFIQQNITKIEHFREVMVAYFQENGIDYEEMANLTQTTWKEQAKHFQSTDTYRRFFAVVSYMLQTNFRIAEKIQKKTTEWKKNNPNANFDIKHTFSEDKLAQCQEYIALLPKLELLSAPLWIEQFQPSEARIEEVALCIEQHTKEMATLARTLGWLPKPKQSTYQPITEEELNDKTLKGWAKTKRDTEVINAYIREGKDIKQLEEVLNVTFG